MRTISRALSVSVLVAVCVLLGGCSGGPSKSANDFISAAQDGKQVEAGSFLVDFEGDVTSLLPKDARPDFEAAEEGPDAAKVVSKSDKRDYMLLTKVDDIWKIKQICFVSSSDVTETLGYETVYEDDPSSWEGEEEVVTEGVNGEAVFTVDVQLLNGESTEVGRKEKQMIRESVAASVRRGIKPRSKGWIALSDRVCSGPLRFRVSDITRESDGLWVTIEFINAIDPNQRVSSARHSVVAGKYKKGSGVWREGYGEERDSVTGPWLEQGGAFETNESESPEESGEPLRFRHKVAPTDDSTVGREDLLFLFGDWVNLNAGNGKRALSPSGDTVVFTINQVYPGPIK